MLLFPPVSIVDAKLSSTICLLAHCKIVNKHFSLNSVNVCYHVLLTDIFSSTLPNLKSTVSVAALTEG